MAGATLYDGLSGDSEVDDVKTLCSSRPRLLVVPNASIQVLSAVTSDV